MQSLPGYSLFIGGQGCPPYLRDHVRALSSEVLPSYDVIIRAIEKELKDIETRIDQIIDDSLEWQEKIELILTMPGIGNESARSLLAFAPELGLTKSGPISSLMGAALFNNDSGQFRGKRSIKGGRGQVRKILYMATLYAVGHNPTIRSFYNRLKNKGKLEKSPELHA